ncbi:MAG: hypothetical protein ABSG53_21255 [Thermoguttaceae bacterium]|jgi:DNA-directed RNA polymerase specialized sigma24 family protein
MKDMNKQEIEVVGRLTAEEATHLYETDRPEFTRRAYILGERLAKRLFRDNPRRDEYVEEAWVAVAECLKEDRNVPNWPGYIYKAVANRCFAYLADTNQPLNQVAQPTERKSNRPVAKGSPEAKHVWDAEGDYEAACEVDGETLAATINGVEQGHEIVDLLEQEYTQKETAAILGLAPTTLKSRVSKLREKIRRK